MSDSKFDVVGIGNALVDVLSHEGDDFVDRMDLVKGSMTLIEEDRAEELYAAMSHRTEMSGGSAANTVAGVASFGGRAAYIGRVRDDDLGTVFDHDLKSLDVTFTSPRASDGPSTGRCMIIVTERCAADDEHLPRCLVDALPRPPRPRPDPASEVTYLEGYLYDRPEAKDAYRVAAEAAHAAGRKVALSLSDSFCVDRHRADFLQLVAEGVDILFANEAEITALCTRSTRSRPPVRRFAGTARSPASPVARRVRSSSPPTLPTRCRPTRSIGWSTRPRPGTSTRPASSTATRRAWPTSGPAGSDRSPPPR